MMKKKISLLLLIVLSLFIFTGCDDNDENVIISNNEKVDVSKMEHQHCTRAANAGEEIKVNLDYDIYYKGENLLLLKSVEQVVSSESSNLDLYEDAYNSIKKNYDGLDYYDQIVERSNDTVSNTIIINYEKINTKALLDIEGEDENIIENGKAKVDKWLELGKKFGLVCDKTSNELDEDLENMEVEEDAETV